MAQKKYPGFPGYVAPKRRKRVKKKVVRAPKRKAPTKYPKTTPVKDKTRKTPTGGFPGYTGPKKAKTRKAKKGSTPRKKPARVVGKRKRKRPARKETQSEANELIYQRLLKAGDRYKEKIKSKTKETPDLYIRTFENADGTVDGELSIRHIPRGLSVHDALLTLAESVKGPRHGQWITTGIRYPNRPVDGEVWDSATKFRGMSDANTNYQEASRGRVAENFITAMTIDERMKKKRRRKATQIYVRLHWNPDDKKPKRR